ncbi:MAG: lipid-transfer protein [Deltaproteobacteria bacterium]|nr:lipid-transfer protein [Deltaproteobacteria bacterium]
MSKLRNVAVVGFAQAPIVACDEHHTAQEMLYPQVRRALADCGVERDAIDYQVAGSADYIDGRPFGFVAALDVMGSWPPRQDLHLEMDAAFAAYYAWLRMQAGDCDSAMVVGYGKVSEGSPEHVLNLQLEPYYLAAIGLDVKSTAALQASAYMARSGATDDDLAEIAAHNRAAGARNPDAQVRQAATAEELRRTPWAVQPLRTGYLPPVGESAVCLILAAEGKAEKLCSQPVWIHGLDQRAEMQALGGRDLSRSASTALAAQKALAMAGLSRADEVDLLELSAATPAEEMIVREAMGLDAKGSTRPAINPSGGPLTGHPILMTGLIRLGEVFRQLSGGAGAHAVAGARRGIAHASQGHCLQHNLVFVLGRERRWS